MVTIRAVIGLGNPGSEYAQTRHNAGFWFLDRVAALSGGTFRSEARFHGELAKVRIDNTDLLLLKPSTFMNRSGQSAQALAAYFKLTPENLLIAHDEMDLTAGIIRLKLGGGHGGHNGLRDIHAHLGANYARMRIGIGHPGHKDRVLGHVLGRAGADDQVAIDRGLELGVKALNTIVTSGWDKAVQQLHSAEAKA